MRDLVYYPTIEEYREAVRGRFHPLFLENSFYSNLIDLVVDTRAPIFYTISHPSEHFAFSGAYHFETEREKYPNVFRRNLFWLHDFTHMLFPYAHDVFEVSEREFIRQFVYQERLASTETELFAYYRIPALRQHVFQDEKLYYDVIRERGWWGPKDWQVYDADHKPDAVTFLNHRNGLVMDDRYGELELEEYPEILAFFQQWRRLTPKWCGERYKSMVGVRIPKPRLPLTHQTGFDYERRISQYTRPVEPVQRQANYESITLDNIVRAYAMLGWDHAPTRWRHVPEALHSLEGAVFFQ